MRRGPSAGRLGYNHSNTCRGRDIELMKVDLEYRSLIQKQDRQPDEHQIDAVIPDQVEETRGHAKKAIHTIQWKIT